MLGKIKNFCNTARFYGLGQTLGFYGNLAAFYWAKHVRGAEDYVRPVHGYEMALDVHRHSSATADVCTRWSRRLRISRG